MLLTGHRDKMMEYENGGYYPSMVAHKLSGKEVRESKKAQDASDAEWNKLRYHERPVDTSGKGRDKRLGVWEECDVRELSDVKAEARRLEIKIHHGRLAELVYLKNEELPEDHQDRRRHARR